MADLKNDIEKYIRGELSPAEMHALEKKALSDPFLSDALEGIDLVNEHHYNEDVKQLETLLHDRIKPKGKQVSLWMWTARIAAGLLILAVTGYVFYSLSEHTATEQLALNKSEETINPVAPSKEKNVEEPSYKKQPQSINRYDRGTQRSGPALPPPSADAKQETVENESQAEVVEEALATDRYEKEEDDNISETEEIVVEQKAMQSAPSPVASNEPTSQNAKRKKESIAKRHSTSADDKVNSKIIQGTVTDAQDGTPLPGVNVMVKGSTIKTETDEAGNYQIELDGNQKNPLVFSYIGMQDLEIPTNNDTINAQLTYDIVTLSDVVVVGYGTVKKADVIGSVSNYNYPQPIGGMHAFEVYLSQNKQYPKEALENEIDGTVIVQFTVKPNGSITNIKVLKGIGFGCDEEVIRLVKEGPKWTPAMRNNKPIKRDVEVELKFTLPE